MLVAATQNESADWTCSICGTSNGMFLRDSVQQFHLHLKSALFYMKRGKFPCLDLQSGAFFCSFLISCMTDMGTMEVPSTFDCFVSPLVHYFRFTGTLC
jgi:hypothetical protein